LSSLYTPYVTRPGRPVGVIVLTILQVLGGIGDIVLGALLILAYVVVSTFVGGGLIAAAVLLLSIVAFVIGILSFVLAYGLWAGKGWGWVLSIVAAIIGIVFGVLALVSSLASGGLTLANVADLVPIILYLIILVYLNTRNVRAFFGRAGGISFGRQMAPAPGGSPYMPQPQPPYNQPPPQAYYQQQGTYPQATPSGTIACSYCGAPNNPAANFCDNCGNRLR
jgi:uncharacterized membrane protein (DUF2068 family)